MKSFRIFPRFTPLTIAYAAMLIAMSAVLYAFLTFNLNIGGGIIVKKLGFGSIPIMLSGMLFGPVVGGIVGGLSDILQYLINPVKAGGYLPVFTLTAILIGVIPSLFYLWEKPGRPHAVLAFFKVLLAVVVTMVVCSFFLNTLWFFLIIKPDYMAQLLTGNLSAPAQALLITRILGESISIPVYSILLHTLYRYRRVYISPRMEQHMVRDRQSKQPA